MANQNEKVAEQVNEPIVDNAAVVTDNAVVTDDVVDAVVVDDDVITDNDAQSTDTNSIVTVVIEGLQRFVSDEGTNVNLDFDIEIPGIVRDENLQYIRGMVKSISMFQGKLTAQLAEISPNFKMVRAMSERSFDQRQLALLLLGATLTLERIFIVAGQEYVQYNGTKAVATRDMYLTNIKKIVFSKRAKAKIEKALDADLF